MRLHDSIDFKGQRILVVEDEGIRLAFVHGKEQFVFTTVAAARRYIAHDFDADYCPYEVANMMGWVQEMAEYAKKVYNPNGNLPEFSYNPCYDC